MHGLPNLKGLGSLNEEIEAHDMNRECRARER